MSKSGCFNLSSRTENQNGFRNHRQSNLSRLLQVNYRKQIIQTLLDHIYHIWDRSVQKNWEKEWKLRHPIKGKKIVDEHWRRRLKERSSHRVNEPWQLYKTKKSWRSLPLKGTLPFIPGGLSNCTVGWNVGTSTITARPQVPFPKGIKA